MSLSTSYVDDVQNIRSYIINQIKKAISSYGTNPYELVDINMENEEILDAAKHNLLILVEPLDGKTQVRYDAVPIAVVVDRGVLVFEMFNLKTEEDVSDVFEDFLSTDDLARIADFITDLESPMT